MTFLSMYSALAGACIYSICELERIYKRVRDGQAQTLADYLGISIEYFLGDDA